MSFTVVWTPSAEADLATLWMESVRRETVSPAADEIDEALRCDPLSEGESRSGNTRILIVPPLAVLFDVFDEDRRVTVWAVMEWGRAK